MKRAFVIALIALAMMMPTYAQTPEAEIDQASIAGNGMHHIDTRSATSLEVVKFDKNPRIDTVAFVLVNGTSETVSDVSVKVEVRDNNGSLAAVGNADYLSIQPQVLRPGEIAVGWASLSGEPGAEMEYSFEVSASNDEGSFAGFDFAEVNLLNDVAVGEFTNSSGSEMSRGWLVGICFNESGAIIDSARMKVDAEIAPGSTESFALDFKIVTSVGCDTFIIGGSSR